LPGRIPDKCDPPRRTGPDPVVAGILHGCLPYPGKSSAWMINEPAAMQVVAGYYIISFPSHVLQRCHAAAANPCLAPVRRINLYPKIKYSKHATIILTLNAL
jgi:hypothetical protein